MQLLTAFLAGVQLAAAAPQMGGMGGMGGMSTSSAAPASTSSAGMGGMGSMGGSGSSSTKQTPANEMTAPQGKDATVTVPAGTQFEVPLNGTVRTPGAKQVTRKYGPIKIGAMSMLENRLYFMAEKPCSDCFVVAMQAGLEDETGTTINIDTGAWLHHMVLFVNGAGKKDTVCPIEPQRMFASGNERTPVRMDNKLKYGVQLAANDNLAVLYDIINNAKEARQYYITMTYEYVTDPSYKAVSMAWLDVTGNCGISYVAPREGKFTLTNGPRQWKSSISGQLLSATGHVHDAGMVVNLKKNGEQICSSPQIYGRRNGYVEGASSQNPDLSHISNTGSCMDFGTVSKGDTMVIDAVYDTTAHPLNKMMDGSLQEIMGISQVYIGA